MVRGPSRMALFASLAAVCTTVGSIAPARAQDDTGRPPAAPPAAAKDDERMTEARKQFQAGVNLLDDPDGAKYELAYHAFHRAYELSHSAKVLGNIGLCALHLERDGEAIDAYSMYLRDAPDVSDREKVQIQRDLATLSSTAVQLKATVKKPGSGFTLVDNRIQTSGGSIVNSYAFDEKELNLGYGPVITSSRSSRPPASRAPSTRTSHRARRRRTSSRSQSRHPYATSRPKSSCDLLLTPGPSCWA